MAHSAACPSVARGATVGGTWTRERTDRTRPDADVAQRLLLHPMWEGATDSEVAFDGKVPIDVVREQRAVMLASVEAQHVARSIGWTGSPTI